MSPEFKNSVLKKKESAALKQAAAAADGRKCTEKHDVVFQAEIMELSGETVNKLISSRYYVFSDEETQNIANSIARHDEMRALAVVNRSMIVQGIVIKSELFELLGRPYCRDVFNKRKISEIMHEARCFRKDINIFYLAELVDAEMKSIGVKYFVALDERGKYAGIFSTRNLLIYLSEITKKDIKQAIKLQNSLFKTVNFEKNNFFELFAANNMALGVGGDFHLQYKYSSTNWLIMLGDVSGKGVASAFITSAISGIFYSYDFSGGIYNFVITMNRFLFKCFQMEKFVTAVIMDFNEKTGEIVLCDMGHSMVYVMRGKKFFRMTTSVKNLPLGIDPDFAPEINKYTLRNGELAFIITDGVIEQINSAHKEYSIERFCRIIKKNSHKDMKGLGEFLLKDISVYRQSMPQHDDITFIFLKYLNDTQEITVKGETHEPGTEIR
ncbi:MAG: hypothetical protein A2096_11430 [Spirochaetes bacterium GWF1_41_5]|nr:MAG: hypothetical protein A2096_11430 [Spirochaetes bacterium GWF1_41_5]HBE02933.1 hypothetical protein [Spirochaetia bacterium]